MQSVNVKVMAATKGITYGNRFFWAYDVAAGVFLKYLIDESERPSKRASKINWVFLGSSPHRPQSVPAATTIGYLAWADEKLDFATGDSFARNAAMIDLNSSGCSSQGKCPHSEIYCKLECLISRWLSSAVLSPSGSWCPWIISTGRLTLAS